MFTLNSILVVSEIAKCWAFLIAVQIYYEILVYRPPYREQVLFNAEKYCVHSYRIVLMAIILKHINGSEGLGIACDIVAFIAACCARAYILFNVAKLHLDKVKQIIKDFKEAVQTKKLLQRTLKTLQGYHFERDERVFSQYRRRNGMIVERLYQYRDIFIG